MGAAVASRDFGALTPFAFQSLGNRRPRGPCPSEGEIGGHTGNRAGTAPTLASVCDAASKPLA